jgi:hypothetical protein
MSSVFCSVIAAVALSSLESGPGSRPQNMDIDTLATPQSETDWAVQGLMWGSSNSDELLDVLTDSQNRVYVSGYRNGLLESSNVSTFGNAIGVVTRYDAYLSNPVNVQIETSQPDVIEALAFMPGTTRLFFAGRTAGAFTNTINSGQFDVITGELNLDTRGFTVQQYGDARPQHPRRLAFNSSQDMLVSGYDDVYIPSNYVESWEDSFVVKVQPSAGSSMLWRANSASQDMAFGMTVDPQDNVYVAGTNLSGTERGMFLRKLDRTGMTVWSKRLSAISMDVGASVERDSHGNVVFGGATYALLGDYQYGDMDVVVKKLDANGVAISGWGSNFGGTTQYGTDSMDWVTDMVVDASGNLYVVGETTGSFNPSTPNKGGSDVFVLKLNEEGRCPQVFQIGSTMDDHPTAVTVDSQGRILVVGHSTGSLFPSYINKGSRDAFILRLTPPPTALCF